MLHYRDIGDYLTRHQKLELVEAALPAPNGEVPVLAALDWTEIEPNEHGDWINQRSVSFSSLTPSAPGGEPSLFELVTNGLKSNRDAWVYNSSRVALDANVSRMIVYFNAQAELFTSSHPNLTGTVKQRAELVRAAIDLDARHFSWGHASHRESDTAPATASPDERCIAHFTGAGSSRARASTNAYTSCPGCTHFPSRRT